MASNLRSAFDNLAEFTQAQRGLVTREQALSVLTPSELRSLVNHVDLSEVIPGVYRFRRDLVTKSAERYACWLLLEPEVPARERLLQHPPMAVFSHESAAAIYGIGKLTEPDRPRATTSSLELASETMQLTHATLSVGEWEVLEGLPVTRPQRIVADLLDEYFSGDEVGSVAADALHRGLVSRPELIDAIRGHAAGYGFDDGDGAALLGSLLAHDLGGGGGKGAIRPAPETRSARPSMSPVRGLMQDGGLTL